MDYDIGIVRRRRIISPDEMMFATVVSTVYQGPGDVMALDAYWGLRAYSLATIGTNAIDLTAADTTVGTFITVAGGGLDMGSINAFISTHGACKISKLYDQTGNGHHLTQATGAQQPAFLTLAVGSWPAISYNGNIWMTSTDNFAAGHAIPYSMFGAFYTTDLTVNNQAMFTASITAGVIGFTVRQSFGEMFFEDVGATGMDGGGAINTWTTLMALDNGASSFRRIDLGSWAPYATPAGTSLTGNFFIGDHTNGNMVGRGLEYGYLHATITSAQSLAINTQIKSFWGI